MEEKNISKHKQEGKHSLDYDSIFKGKKDDFDETTDLGSTYRVENFEYEQSSVFYHEAKNNEVYIREKLLKDEVFRILSEKTDINFEANRRKPSAADLNLYYDLLVTELKVHRFTYSELFTSLSEYFSDNYLNMFKLLGNKYRNLVIDELQEHIGKATSENLKVSHRNLILNAEVEFLVYDEIEERVIDVTGIIIDILQEDDRDITTRVYKIDSFENIYLKKISDITKIINNVKYKYNLNKLNNIDFL